MQVQELYDKLKHRAMMGHIQGAAEDAADSSLGVMAGIGGVVPTNVQGPGAVGDPEPTLLYQGPSHGSHNNYNFNDEYRTHNKVTEYRRPLPQTMGAQSKSCVYCVKPSS